MDNSSLTPDLIELYSDILKIGIPSVIAIISAFFGYLISLKSHQKDVYIEKLRADLDREKDTKEKVSQLIQDISFNVSESHALTVQYATNLCVMVEHHELGTTYSEKNREFLSKVYDELTASLYKGTETKTKVYLLGDEVVIKIYENFWGSTAEFTNQFFPQHDWSREEIMSGLISLGEEQEKLLLKLSKIYLNNDFAS